MNALEQNLNIQINDDVRFEFNQDTILDVYENSDPEMDEPVEELFKEGSIIEGTVCDITDSFYGVQLGDGSFTFINKMDVIIKQVN